MFRGLTGREILLRQADNGAGASGGTPGQGDPGAGGSGGNQAGGGGTPQPGGQGAPTFESWYGTLDTGVRGLIDNHISGLKNALASERTAVTELRERLTEMSGKLGKDSPERQQMEALQASLKTHEQQAAFYDAAHANGVTNLRLAWLAAQEGKLFDADKGTVDWAKFKTQFPELFRATAPAPQPGATNPGNAGRSTGPLTKEMLKGMSAAEINARWDEVRTVMAQG